MYLYMQCLSRLKKGGARVSRFLNRETNTASSSSSSTSNHPEDWSIHIDGVWVYNPALARARHVAAARLINDALPQTSRLALKVQITINDRPPTTINGRLPTAINDKPPSTLNDKPPVEPPQPAEPMPACSGDLIPRLLVEAESGGCGGERRGQSTQVEFDRARRRSSGYRSGRALLS